MHRHEAEQVVAGLKDPAQWAGDDYSRACRLRVDDVAAVERPNGGWAVRLLFHQGPHRMGIETGRLERLLTTQEPCTPDELAGELQMFAVEEPHGDLFGDSTDASGRLWFID